MLRPIDSVMIPNGSVLRVSASLTPDADRVKAAGRRLRNEAAMCFDYAVSRNGTQTKKNRPARSRPFAVTH